MAHAPRRHAHRSIGAKALGLLIACGLLAAVNVAALGADEEEEQPETIVLHVAPARPPYRALRDHLLPTSIELTPGDAAPLYLKACLMISETDSGTAERDRGLAAKWLDTPLAALPRVEARQMLDRHRGLLELVRTAARRERCDWALQYREEYSPGLLLPEIDPLRTIGWLVALDARLDFAAGDRSGAIEALQTGLALARHAAMGPTLVHGSLGVFIAQAQLNALREGLQSASDNFYWALATLPSPLVDRRFGFDMERDAAYWFFPPLRGAVSADRSPAEWRAAWDNFRKLLTPQMVYLMSDRETRPQGFQIPDRNDPRAFAAMLARAKAILSAEGWPPAKVAACSEPQILLVGTALGYEHFSDEAFKQFGAWSLSAGRFSAAEGATVANAREREVVPLAALIAPTLLEARSWSDGLRRDVAALTIVEALRLHAANHDGRLPAKLADIHETPIPGDPVTGEPFDYVMAENVATLSMTAPAEHSAKSRLGLRWEIRIAK